MTPHLSLTPFYTSNYKLKFDSQMACFEDIASRAAADSKNLVDQEESVTAGSGTADQARFFTTRCFDLYLMANI